MNTLKTSTTSLSGGRSFCHHAAETVVIPASSFIKGSTIFRAMSAAVSMPLILPRSSMFFARPAVS